MVFGIKIIVFILSVLGIVDMWMVVFVDIGVIIFVVLNFFRVLKIEN